MNAEFTRRNVKISIRLTAEEHALLRRKMALSGVTNQEAYMRKMILDGFILKLNLPELKEIIYLMRCAGNNINQIAKRLNQSGRIYETDIADIREKQEKLWEMLNNILTGISAKQG